MNASHFAIIFLRISSRNDHGVIHKSWENVRNRPAVAAQGVLRHNPSHSREEHMRKSLLLSGLLSTVLTFVGTALAADIPEACNSYTAAVTGGPLPPAE